MKKKLNLISLSKDELSKKQKARVLGGETSMLRKSCCCSGDFMSGWNGVRRFRNESLE